MGDAGSDKGLRVEEVDGAVYRMDENDKSECGLSVVLPPEGETWMALLKVSCVEGKVLAAPRNYGMKVIGVVESS